MNFKDVQLIGVIDPDGKEEAFVYTLNAPTNLWIGAICSDGTRMGAQFMAHVLNGLIEADSFAEGDTYVIANQNGTKLTATVGEEVPADAVDAFQANSDTVRTVTVSVG